MRNRIQQIVTLSLFPAFLIGAGIASHAQSLRAVDIEAEEQQSEELITQSIDDEREQSAPGAAKLTSDPALVEMARARSYAMAHGAPFAHEDDAGRFVADGMVRARFGHYGSVGENIMMEQDAARAFDPETLARRAVRGWMNSEGHRANILSRLYTRTGVGVVVNGSHAYATQLFWGPAAPRNNRRQP